jgi:predicted GH43/DUF377 family glycosyl hydrolase
VTGPAPLLRHVPAELRPDPRRVVARLFLPGEELPMTRSRAGAVIARVLALPESEVEDLAAGLLRDFAHRHRDYPALLDSHAWIVNSHLGEAPHVSDARALLVGASFTAEYAVEGAALCNPSAVLHSDQAGLQPGQARVAVSLRGIGEGHVSSIGFCAAVVGPGPRWSFEPRTLPAVAGSATAAPWEREHLRAVLADQSGLDELSTAVLSDLPPEFTGADFEQALAAVHHDLVVRPGAHGTVDVLRRLVSSAYDVEFPVGVELDQQVLLPTAAEERNGMEDARFVRFVDDDGAVDYRATYTAYDGHRIEPRLLTSPDLRAFRAHRIAGPAARNKGMALFPRRVGGQYLTLCRCDGESTSLASSPDGFVWGEPRTVHAPAASWEVLQVGNCGPPIATDRGWLVLTHGVGAMRTYAIGAILLDRDDPARMLARLERPLLRPAPEERDGYVPNVVYSCGGLVHDGLLWLPYGIGDARIGVAWVPVEELLDGMAPVRDIP